MTLIRDAFERVLAQPESIAARKALAAAYHAEGEELRGTLIDLQLAVREHTVAGDYGARYREREAELKQLIAEHRSTFAGRVAELVDDFTFERGLVARVTVSGERFPRVAAELFTLAPIQHLTLTLPLGDIAAIFVTPELGRLATLGFDRADNAFGDAGATELAESPFVAGIRYISLYKCGVGRAGVEALAASPQLVNTLFIELTENPADPTPTRAWWDTGGYGTEPALQLGRPDLAVELEKKFGPRPWLAMPTGELAGWEEIATAP